MAVNNSTQDKPVVSTFTNITTMTDGQDTDTHSDVSISSAEKLSSPNTEKGGVGTKGGDIIPNASADAASVSSSSSSASSASSSPVSPDIPESAAAAATHLRLSSEDVAQFSTLFHKTLQEVGGIAKLRVGDIVLTPFGEGKLLELGESTQVALPWGILCTRMHNLHRKLPQQEFQEAMDHLNEMRKLQLALECQKWNVPLQIDGCVGCLLERPEYKAKRVQQQSKWSRFRQRVDSSRNKKPKLWECDVCGNLICKFHDRQQQKGGEDNFHMCVDCAFDLNQVEHQLNAYHPHALQNLERLLHLYTRMCIQFSFWLPYVPQLCSQIFQRQRKNAKISLGTTGLGFVGAALGVAGAATMLTPAGPAILIAAMATSATSGTLQATHQGYDRYFASKVTHEISDRLIGWHGLCCGILQTMEQLRKDLLAERMHYTSYATLSNFARNQKANKKNELWNTLAVGSMGMTRSAFTGVGVTSAMGAGYAQVLNSSLQTVPVVGAAFSVTYMAMDAGNIYQHLQQLSTPNSYIVKLQQLQASQIHGGLPHISTLENEVELLGTAIGDLKTRLDRLRLEQEKEQSDKKQEGDGAVSQPQEELPTIDAEVPTEIAATIPEEAKG
eukprot:scaffold9435_cov137-Cylindrotheca_fusiformis.AAC.6